MTEEKATEKIVEENSVETTTDISAPTGERSEVTESEGTKEVTTEVVVPDKIELTVTEDSESDE